MTMVPITTRFICVVVECKVFVANASRSVNQ